MFKSRQRFGNDLITVAIDTTSGEILELVNRKNGDNLIKSTPFSLPNMFSIRIGQSKLSVPNLVMTREHPELKAVISDTKNKDGTEIIIEYGKLTDGKEVFDIGVTVRMFVPDNSARIILSADVKNNGSYEIDNFCFPILSSVYLGEKYKDDILVYPYNSGMKFHNPVEYISKKPKAIFWRWQEYRYCYYVDGVSGYKNQDGVYSYSSAYSGALSMAWLDLYDDCGGLYYGMHERNGICRLRADTLGPDSPGMIFCFEKTIEHKNDFSFNNACIALHCGDWHEGADIYKEVHDKSTRTEPSWWNSSVSLVAHYDFKYQNGGVVHRFSDIPSLVEQAKSLNSDHILISGWHTDGFDNGFPEYFADKDLGTEDDLAEGLRYASENGIKVSFYINTRIANRKFVHLTDFINDNAVIKRDGSPEFESYGDKSISFATMCAGSKGWQNRLFEAVEYVTKLGATGVYLDQLGMAPPKCCHSKEHDHEYDGWCEGYEKLLEKAAELKTLNGEPISIIIEGMSDMYGPLANAGLVSTFVSLHSGAFPELYRYTFPNQMLVDMVYPKQNLAMRPVHVAQRSSDMINKAFVTDMNFWIYDLEEDNSFFGDPEQLDYLRGVLNIKKYWHDTYKDFVFADTKGIYEMSGELDAKAFYKDDMCLIAYTSDGKTVCDLKMAFNADLEEYVCLENEYAVTEELNPDLCYIRIAYSRCGIILLKKR